MNGGASTRRLTGVALYQSRILNDVRITPETLRAMEPRIALSTDVILPGSELDVVAYGCTSASMAIGEEKVFEKIRSVRPNAKCTTPITAAFAAFRAMGAKRIGVLTPYRADVNRIVADYIRARGFDVPVFGSFNEENDGVVARITPKSIEAGIDAIKKGRSIDAVFVSCTSVRLASAAARIEDRDRPAGHLLQSCHGLACIAARRHRRQHAAMGPALRTAPRVDEARPHHCVRTMPLAAAGGSRKRIHIRPWRDSSCGMRAMRSAAGSRSSAANGRRLTFR